MGSSSSTSAQSSTYCAQVEWGSWSFSPHIYIHSKFDMFVRKSCHMDTPGYERRMQFWCEITE